MRKIVVRLRGGLGNQMFQYAFARNLAAINNAKIKLDNRTHYNYVEWNCGRPYLLDKFNINATPATQDELNWSNNVRIWQRLGLCPKWLQYHEMEFGAFNEQFLSPVRKNILLEGFWQNENYFSSVSSHLKEELRPKKKYDDSYINEILQGNSVGMHIRRGDYIHDPTYRNQYIDLFRSGYYKNAVEYFSAKIDAPVFYIFSDDIEWCRKNILFQGSRIVFIENTADEVHDFYLMSHCQHQVIANSTFSWWAAWLNRKADKIVICPRKWFLDDRVDHQYCGKGWVEL